MNIHKANGRNHVIILTNAERPLARFPEEAARKKIPKHNKGCHDKTTADFMLN